MPHMVWTTLPDGFHDYYNAQWYEFTGMPQGSTDGDAWNGMFHPDDQDRAWARWRHSLATGEPYEIEYRLRHRSGEYRWTLGRARPIRNDSGQIVRWIGTCTDIDEAKRTAEQNELLSRELSHRIKNIFAVISGLIGLSVREFPGCKAFAYSLRERIAALGRAHQFVHPYNEESKPATSRTTLKGLLTDIFKPYPASETGRLRLSGDDLVVDDRGATPIALVFHELAINAAKYGALSSDEGTVTVEIARRGEAAILTWQEQGGPAVKTPPTRSGFGSRLTKLSIVDQLGGSIDWEWRPEGLFVTIEVERGRLARGTIEA